MLTVSPPFSTHPSTPSLVDLTPDPLAHAEAGLETPALGSRAPPHLPGCGLRPVRDRPAYRGPHRLLQRSVRAQHPRRELPRGHSHSQRCWPHTLLPAPCPLIPLASLTAQGQLGLLAVPGTGHTACHAAVGAHVSLAHAGDVGVPPGSSVTPGDAPPATRLPPRHTLGWCSPGLGGSQGRATVFPGNWGAGATPASGKGSGQLHPAPPPRLPVEAGQTQA